MTRKIKKQKDLWDTFQTIQQKYIDSCQGTPKVLGIALANIEWEGYAKALFEFGIINQKDFDEIMAWRPI